MNALHLAHGQYHLETLHRAADTHGQLAFLRARRSRRLRHALKTLYRLAREELLGLAAASRLEASA
jgi:hypothetical protein